MAARDIDTQIYKFVFSSWGGCFVLGNDGFVTRIKTKYGITYVDDKLIIFLDERDSGLIGYMNYAKNVNYRKYEYVQ